VPAIGTSGPGLVRGGQDMAVRDVAVAAVAVSGTTRGGRAVFPGE
jgi:hypothetical protein